MLLRVKTSKHMVEVSNLADLMNLHCEKVVGLSQEGEDIHDQDVDTYEKSNLTFLSGEALPRCWTDPHYRDKELNR